jgi:CheY-like chemotaxis protein
MSGLKMMMFDNGTGRGIRCRFISGWYKVDSFLPDRKGLLSEIEKNDPDVVLMDLDLYSEIDGIKTARTIRNKYNIPVLYKV